MLHVHRCGLTAGDRRYLKQADSLPERPCGSVEHEAAKQAEVVGSTPIYVACMHQQEVIQRLRVELVHLLETAHCCRRRTLHITERLHFSVDFVFI